MNNRLLELSRQMRQTVDRTSSILNDKSHLDNPHPEIGTTFQPIKRVKISELSQDDQDKIIRMSHKSR